MRRLTASLFGAALFVAAPALAQPAPAAPPPQIVRGTVTAVEANPASDLLVVDGSHLVPVRFVVSHSPGRVVVDVPEGIFG